MAGDEFEKRVVEDRLQYQNAIDTMYLIFICEYIILYYSNEKNPYGFINNSKNLKKLLSQTKYIQALSNGDKSCISRKRRLIIELLKYKQYLMCIIMARILF